MRRIVQRGATPAVLRLYDAIEGDRNFKTGDANVLLALDEGDAHVVEATRRIVDEECKEAGALDVAWWSNGWDTATTCPRSRR
jgi:alkyldihydroxyacetonephosphate synthase